jgi:acyl-[acyl-carrier-protein]-phospholipid O-acyltransferase/long-chain-fatty-acid--[acyl-carrier-protein] ligase
MPTANPSPAAPPSAFNERLARWVRRFAGLAARGVYRIKAAGIENLPAEGGVLLLPNHITWVDAVLLQLACPRPIRFLIFDTIYRQPLLNPVLRLFQAIPISPVRAKEGLRAAVEQLQAGEVVCLFPEGALTRTGTLLKLQKGFELIARKAGAPVVPVWLDQLWGSIFSFEGGKYFRKIPQHWPYPVTIAFGEALAAEDADVSTVREKLLQLGEQCYEDRPLLKRHLGEMCIRGLKKDQFSLAVIDGMDHSTLTRGTLLAAACALAGRLKAAIPGKRVAIVLPPSKGAVLANLAVLLAGKIPVNLNFTAGRDSLQAAIRRGDVGAAITAKIVERKLENFPWPEIVLRMDDEMPPLKKKIVFWRGLVVALPWRALARLLKIPKRGGHDEAVLLFTSGSSGEPKGVVLSHRNILGNVSQFRVMVNLQPQDAVLASLPFFHSFGCTVTLWFPMIEGLRAVTYPNPLEVSKNAELIQRYGCSLFLATPTFLRSYLRKAEKEQFASVRLVVTGAEKLPRETAKAFEEKFGKQVMEGYGLTETSPVVSVNLPDVAVGEDGKDTQPAYRPGSVGKLAPGMAAQIRDPDSGEHKSLHDTGMLWLRGPNIFEGYLGEPEKTAEVVQDGWFKTGDLGRFDDDGFLFIEGRLSRFSKIAGEMVPHETVESKIGEALGLAKDERSVVIVGVPDAAKGEALVLLSTVDINLADLRGKLSAMGVPNLWAPRTVRRVDALPVLGTGKLDLKGCKDLALKGAEGEA